ncbi:cationic trypsin-like [Anoplophora glabripennis]|uniref:cationic trypsin-like n=1 Tax=Anoplophora glabripennis TaxID=217634 RepID=UPI0008754342|nr:cationic trypsin-like [Anoplophora glabripennis]
MCISLIYLVLVSLVPVVSASSTPVTGYENITEYQTTTNIAQANTEAITTTYIDTTTQNVPNQESNKEYPPFQVSLHYSYNDDFICGGSIISPKIVLTAAHCMYYRWGGLMPPIIVTVAAGRRKLNESAWRSFGVANITLHPLFNKTSMDNDLAVIEIEGRFETDSLVSQIDVEKHVTSLKYNDCIVTGWNQDSYEFQVMEVVLIDCVNYPHNICTNKKYPQTTQCINNAGNPLVCEKKLIGVLSVESECEDPNQLFIFENIRYSMSWLNETIGSGAEKIEFKYIFNLFLVYMIFRTILYVE